MLMQLPMKTTMTSKFFIGIEHYMNGNLVCTEFYCTIGEDILSKQVPRLEWTRCKAKVKKEKPNKRKK